MKVINKSRKIIGIAGEPLLPGNKITLKDGLESHPTIQDYLKKGILANVENITALSTESVLNAAEREKIEAEAISKYKAEQEAKANEIKSVKAMKKDELLKKAISMEIEVKDDDTAEAIREQILNAIGQ